MDSYARQEQAGPWKVWHEVCVCVRCGGGLLMSPRWGAGWARGGNNKTPEH